MRKGAMIWAAGLLILAAAGIVTTRTRAAGEPPEPAAAKSFTPVTNVEQLMEGQEMLFKGIRKAITENKWDVAAKQAWILAELANVNVHHARKPQYADFARDMSAKCVDLAKTLKTKDAAEAKKAAGVVNESCKTCHDQFQKKRKR